MTLNFTEQPSTAGGEPIGLLKALAYEYILDLVRTGQAELSETVGADGGPALILIIPNVKYENGMIQDVPKVVPQNPEGATDGANENPEGANENEKV